jgi:hypothetical protein
MAAQEGFCKVPLKLKDVKHEFCFAKCTEDSVITE